jgi:transposase
MRYSNDLREKVAKRLQVSDLDNVKLIEISKDFEIDISTLKKWVKKLQEGTLYQVSRKGGKPRVYDYQALKKFVEDNPDKYLREIKAELFEANGQKASTSGIDDALKRLDLKLKKKSISSKKEMKKKETLTEKN